MLPMDKKNGEVDDVEVRDRRVEARGQGPSETHEEVAT
jgi:hypothetical protein